MNGASQKTLSDSYLKNTSGLKPSTSHTQGSSKRIILPAPTPRRIMNVLRAPALNPGSSFYGRPLHHGTICWESADKRRTTSPDDLAP